MRRSEKNWMEYEQTTTPFLPPGSHDAVASVTTELRDRMAKVEQQVLSQYTATAAYATLGQQAVEQARAEARADLDRSQATIIGLLDRLRADLQQRLDALEVPRHLASSGAPAPVAPVAGGDLAGRISAMEEQLAALTGLLEATVHQNEHLRQQVDELQQRAMRREGWLVSGDPSDLTLG
ncbi:MAG: hypothetical protein F2681_09960 [Actinobacteria bacterium]|uniref:Unannotated protein n=1 Tax=freshwater metagenome TaxID=449393 RepID=A0A6J7AJQ8_9ZZZZ|nr:hypothetical protein [Actinomycetota bacterium]MSW76866.1 hypothetical protein [Actinomycetota bacterium]MSX53987.1 hypothetical protein [Actinomycetota bacterium]MSX94049.1 hypothetical protein [Actinomycetota bacterium]MSZ83456.1 hypothetical protein [Actinomycetota bacterium]